ncbi:UNVERIFIED_ORG: hypothetical protein FHW05_004778 [Pantoea agglomerans]
MDQSPTCWTPGSGMRLKQGESYAEFDRLYTLKDKIPVTPKSAG